MDSRNWRRLIAKKKRYEQSLFEHSLIELDMALQLLPLFRQPNFFSLSELEEHIVLLSLIAHDLGKERPQWQEYVLGRQGFLSDVDVEYTAKVLPELLVYMGFGSLNHQVIEVINNCVNLHMKHERSDANLVLAIMGNKNQEANRWFFLANLVYHIDNICSAKGVFEALDAFKQSPLNDHLKLSYHHVVLRGVSTAILHRAVQESFIKEGWIPLLLYTDSTLYASPASQMLPEPSTDVIERCLAEILQDATGKDVTEFMVGSPTANILPKPELFEYKEIRRYLEAAARKVGRKSFLTAYEREKKKNLSGRGALADSKKCDVIKQYWQIKNKTGEAYSVKMDLDAYRISTAHPDIIVFKFFKAAMRPEFLGAEGTEIVQKEYEKVFGEGSWQNLLSTSTLMAARDMANTVDYYWMLPGQKLGVATSTIEELSVESRTKLLIEILTKIAEQVYASIQEPPTRAILATQMAKAFISDLICPVTKIDINKLVNQQMEYYSVSKQFAGKQSRNASYLCPICNIPFKSGTKAKSDFIDKPESHTNRGVAHGPFDYVNICDTCKYERILRQLLLQERASEFIVLLPRMNIGHYTGGLFVQKAKSLYLKALSIMAGDTDNPDRRLWLAFTPYIADQVMNLDLYRIKPEELVERMSYHSGEETKRKNLRQLEKSLREKYDDDLDNANDEWMTDFSTWEEAAKAIHSNKVRDPNVQKVRDEIYKLGVQMQLICETPNMILFPLTYPIGFKDDSDTNAGLRKTFMASLLGLTLDASVGIIRDSDLIDFQGGEGVAFVPPVSAVRNLIGTNWISIDTVEDWVRAIGVASILARDGKYSERTGLYEVLISPTAGHVLRRIEQKYEQQNQSLTWKDVTHLKIFEEAKKRLKV